MGSCITTTALCTFCVCVRLCLSVMQVQHGKQFCCKPGHKFYDMHKVISNCSEAAGSGSQTAATSAMLAARFSPAVSWVVAVASLSAAVASVKQASAAEQCVNTATTKSFSLFYSRHLCRASSGWCRRNSCWSLECKCIDLAWHGSNTGEQRSITILLQGNCTGS